MSGFVVFHGILDKVVQEDHRVVGEDSFRGGFEFFIAPSTSSMTLAVSQWRSSCLSRPNRRLSCRLPKQTVFLL
jgi:hypothetical protein